ncbi:disease resistance protein PIK6-NP-like [Lolium rigidum]|uniref:disease resistance protein PIK6-NP-like n=1 Tax=Lolium rigidum TaxID=89674 RepID=UPI001F5DABB4|nr:disease resistance protein PIK6-NP-like [Lolium rigidum]
MEGAPVSVATGALKPVVEKLFALLGDEYTRFKGVRDQIRFLTSELTTMHAFLLKMSEEEEAGHDPLDKAWMKEVRELSYDMEDSIDDFMTSVDDKDAKPDGFINKIKHSLGKLGKMKTSRRISKEMEELSKQISEVRERNSSYRTGRVIAKMSNLTVDPRALVIFKHASELVGIDEPKAEIIKMLTEDEPCGSAPQHPKVVAIVGFGGIGKTTLAKQVQQELEAQFQCSSFISVSRTPDMMKILRTILSEVSKQDYVYTKAGSIQHLISKCFAWSLLDQRYFVVIDDIWSVEAWEIIHYAFPKMSGGSIIITTSRNNDVAQSCSASFTGCVYNIRPLAMVHSRKLFHRRLFKYEEDFPSHLKDVSDEILRKCAGLPLAIIAISGLLANKENTEHEWDQVKVSIGCGLERNPSVEGMMKIISLSYFDLPAHLKTCLLYLSIFPEDAIIQKKSLILRWIAEGFIYNEGRYTLYELGKKFFNELVNRSLIQPMKMVNGVVKSCRVHDIILDFIIPRSIEENFVSDSNTTETESKVRRLSLQGDKEGNSFVPDNLVLYHIRSLHVFGHSGDITSLNRFTHLRVLNFEDCHHLENHYVEDIGRLLQLRYLNLSGTQVSELPRRIGTLLCLEMLDLRRTAVGELPASIVNLKKMAHLYVDFGVIFPNGIAKMEALERCINVHISRQSTKFLQELGQLKNLKNVRLNFEGVCGTGDESRVTEVDVKAIVSSLQNLRTLQIKHDGNFLMEALFQATPGLQKLIVSGSTITRVPDSVGSLVRLRLLRLWMDRVGEEDLCILGGLPALLNLVLFIRKRKDVDETRVIVSGAHRFSCLREFGYDIRDDEMDLMFAAGSMPKVERFITNFDVVKTESFTGGDFDFGIENLTCLTTIYCGAYGGTIKTNDAAKDAMEKKVRAHPNHPSLTFAYW